MLLVDPATLAALSDLSIATASTGAKELQPSPIERDWILEGEPTARALTLTEADDGKFSSGLWDCTAGKFKYIYVCDEIVHILEGEVIVQDARGIYTLRPGDVAFFPQGLTTFWTVPNYVRKFCIHRTKERGLFRRIASALKRRLRGLFADGRSS